MDNSVDTREQALVITPDELPADPRENKIVVVNPEKNISVTMGVPTVEDSLGKQLITIPNSPHIFQVNELTVRDKDHPGEKFEDVTVLLSHGYRAEDGWRFVDQQTVVETVEAYNQFAQQNNRPEVEFVVSCNPERYPDWADVKIADFDERRNLVYAVGENVGVSTNSQVTPEGKVMLDVSIYGKFQGLNDFIPHRIINLRS